MKLKHRINLIPRNNWDYGVNALFTALQGIAHFPTQSPNTEQALGSKPIWTNSGRTSLFAILKSLNLPPDAKIGVPLYCCSVVFNAILQAGYTPCFIDSNLDDCNLSINDLIKKKNDFDAIIVVHMFGKPCNMEAINSSLPTIPIIEDCAQSVFAEYKEKQTGLQSTVSFFSFRCGKYLSAGEGSAILCNDKDVFTRIGKFVDSFESPSVPEMIIDSFLTYLKATLYRRPLYGLLGYPVGMRLDKRFNLTAKDGFKTGKIAASNHALIESRIRNFREKINLQRKNAHMLLEQVVPEKYRLLSEGSDVKNNWFQFPIRFANSNERDTMADFLFDRGIDTSKYLDSIIEEARMNYQYAGDCPSAELLSKTILLVPIHYTLGDRDIKYIMKTLSDGFLSLENQVSVSN